MTDERSEGMGGGRVAADELRLLIERAERLEEEKKGISDEIKDVMGEAKDRRYEAKAIKKIMANRKKKKEDRKSGIEGKGVTVSEDLGGRRRIIYKNHIRMTYTHRYDYSIQ